MEDMGKNLRILMDKKDLNRHYDELMAKVMRDPAVQQFIAAHREQLDQAMIDRSAAKLYEFVTENNKFKAKQTSLAPGYQPRLLLNHHFIDVTYEPTAELVAAEQAKALQSRVRSISMPKNIRDARLSQFYQDDDRFAALDAVTLFLDDYTKTSAKFHQGLYLYGNFGVGKTYLLGALAHELALRGFQTTLVHFPTFAVEMKNAIGQQDLTPKLEAIKRSRILMIDDIGADSMSSWIRDDVLGVVLQYRMQEELATFFSSNFSMQQLEHEHLSVTQRGEQEPLKAKRIMERVRFLSREVELLGQNRRLQP
ncbi:primosomal protein DnaI [Loigolactobacillus jiayinensis]|uniref:Primosomal protein DnaI n=1 Tax=Loigolactobacillus jiayinensis TaxID=2486016 RepID=A0ABW1REX8_9LACO|nr:primosomal protein DnaI [Loigolactobacillus jiayinensis]